ncbi:hypothetical protein DY000_02009724 [Brassica cretica]|uniref:Dolichyl-diphosphooligosaccharide--protein glycosyltransferase subunit 2 n=1 Tax=Brassica cretica TaxID=69181 RepID=A0ABQ7CI84_BRACR|nr:hypothetical protein DY000_02009724 [Brassica cretica]
MLKVLDVSVVEAIVSIFLMKCEDGRRSRTVSGLDSRRSNLRCCFIISSDFKLSPIRGLGCVRTCRWILQKVLAKPETFTVWLLVKAQDLFVCVVDDCVRNHFEFAVFVVFSLEEAYEAKLLLDFYYSVRALVLVNEQFSGNDISFGDAEAIFLSIKILVEVYRALTCWYLVALSQSDGRWRYSSNNPESSSFAAGLAFETLGGVISLAPSEIDQSLIQTLKTSILKLFDSIQKYDDGTFYFDGSEGPISTTASVIRGLTSFAAAESTRLNLAGDNIVGLAKFFLGVGIPGDAKDFFNQIDALACLED